MNRIFIIFLVFFLILFTAIIKNSTKRIDDEILSLDENLRDLKIEFNTIKLEYDYLSSAEKLLELQDLYFEEKLIKKKIQEMNIIISDNKIFNIQELTLSNEK